jgi:hypothetical protein
MNDYIILDGYKYHTAAESWEPNEERPMVIRRLMSGSSNVTFGPATFTGWRGTVLVDVTPAAGFGSIDNMRTTYRKRQVLSFTDHYGTVCNVVIDRGVGEKSISPMWTAVDNVFRINLSLVKL